MTSASRMVSKSTGQPPVVVLACHGADEGPLGVVRSLGRMDVPSIVIAERSDTPVAASKYVRAVIHVPEFTNHPERLLAAVEAIAAEYGRPILFPTADPDLLLLTRHEDRFPAKCEVMAPPYRLVSTLSNKERFVRLAMDQNLRVPRTTYVKDEQSLASICATIVLPAIVKPSLPQSWQIPGLAPVVGDAKAIKVNSRAELASLSQAIARFTFDFLIQEYVPGEDDEHFDVHAYFDRNSEVRAWFCGQKLRISPPHAGSGCFVVSRQEEAVVRLALDTLQKIGYRGIANLNFKRNAQTGQFWLLEINPRVSQWNILPAHCGINLPYLAYLDAIGRLDSQMQPPRQVNGIHYLNFKNDWGAFRIYRREGILGMMGYVRTLLVRPMVYQVFDREDLRPFFATILRLLRSCLARWLGGWLGGLCRHP